MASVYYDPDKFGLKVLGDIDWSSGLYEFDQTVVWQDEQGQMYYADDSGCSCPSPFEAMGRDDLTPCTFPELQAHLEKRLEGCRDEEREGNQAAVVNLLGRLRSGQGLAA
jgi:hypothetical protein